MGVDKMGVDEMGVDEMGNRRNGNKPIFPCAQSAEFLCICKKNNWADQSTHQCS